MISRLFIVSVVLLLTLPISLLAQTLETEFDGLGGNQIILDKARELNPDTQMEVVQDRIVPRKHRFEFAPEFSGAMGGDDTYTKSQSLGMNINYHINHRWSIGAKYNHTFNKLTAEGEAMVDAATEDRLANPRNPTKPLPDIDHQKSESLVVLNWYPIYGKMNLFEKKIAQFDIYGLLGVGQVELKSGSKPTHTVGGGIGFWLSPQISTRMELRYQKYNVEYVSGPKGLDLAIASVQVGWLL